MLHEFVSVNRDEIITRCKGKVTTRSKPTSAKGQPNHGVPMFLDQLTDALAGLSKTDAIERAATRHGADLLRQGFTVSQVVHEYGDVCQAITELAIEMNAPISTIDFRLMSRCLDAAIAGAVTEYVRDRSQLSGSGVGR